MFLIRKAHQFPPEGFFIFAQFLLLYSARLFPGLREIPTYPIKIFFYWVTYKEGYKTLVLKRKKQISNYRRPFSASIYLLPR